MIGYCSFVVAFFSPKVEFCHAFWRVFRELLLRCPADPPSVATWLGGSTVNSAANLRHVLSKRVSVVC